MKLIFLFCILLGVVQCKKLPSFVEPCHRNDPKIDDCLLRNVEKLRPRFLKGIPELQIPSFNPLVITEATLKTGNNFMATFKNIEIFHAEDFIVDEFEIDIQNFRLVLAVHFSNLRIKASYAIDGKLLVLQLDGHGQADGNYTDVRAKLEANGTRYMKNGKNHIKATDYKIDLEIGKAHLFFDRIFGDNQELNDQTNKIINENSAEIINELIPVVKEIIGEFGFGIVNRLFEKYSDNDLFPEP